MPDKSVDLVLTDPPYNISKAEWDKWKRKEDYIEWMGQIFKECERLLKDNGSFYFFHNDMMQIKNLMQWLEDNTKFIFKQFIVWNKRFEGASNKGFLDGFIEVGGLRNYQQMAEYCLYYTFQDETGLTTVMLDTNNFSTLRQYFKDFQEALGLNKREIIERVGQNADHCFRWGSSQWDLPTLETYTELCELLPINIEFIRREYEDLRREYEDLRYTFNNQKTHHSVWNYEVADTFNIREWQGFREYEDLRREYEDLRYTFNNQKTHHSVWNYEIAPKIGHVTPKPVPLIENIINHSSNPNDIILDPFLGSGTTAVAALNTGRFFIGIEKEPKYVEIARKRLEQAQAQQSLFA